MSTRNQERPLVHNALLRKGIVGPGRPGERVFESNFVIECTCGRSIGCATTSEATAERWRAEHVRDHAIFEDKS